MSGRSYFPRLINLSINDFSSAISYWFTFAKVSWKFCSAASASVMSRTMAEKKLRSIRSKNLHKELDNFSTAFMNKMKRRKIYLFSGKYFEVERLIVERKSTEEVSRAACHSFSLHAFFLGGYIFAPLKKQGFFFYLLERKKGKSAWKRNQWTRSLFRIAPVDRQNKIVQDLVGCMRRPGCDIINGIFPLIRRLMSSKGREKSDIFTALLKTVYIRRNWLLIYPSRATFCILKVVAPDLLG